MPLNGEGLFIDVWRSEVPKTCLLNESDMSGFDFLLLLTFPRPVAMFRCPRALSGLQSKRGLFHVLCKFKRAKDFLCT